MITEKLRIASNTLAMETLRQMDRGLSLIDDRFTHNEEFSDGIFRFELSSQAVPGIITAIDIQRGGEMLDIEMPRGPLQRVTIDMHVPDQREEGVLIPEGVSITGTLHLERGLLPRLLTYMYPSFQTDGKSIGDIYQSGFIGIMEQLKKTGRLQEMKYITSELPPKMILFRKKSPDHMLSQQALVNISLLRFKKMLLIMVALVILILFLYEFLI